MTDEIKENELLDTQDTEEVVSNEDQGDPDEVEDLPETDVSDEEESIDETVNDEDTKEPEVIDPTPPIEEEVEEVEEVVEESEEVEVPEVVITPVVEAAEEVVVEVTTTSEQELRDSLKNVLSEDERLAASTAQLILYRETGMRPRRTKRNNFVVDVRRNSSVKEWKSSELEDWLEGAIDTSVSDQTIRAEIQRRWKIPGNWCDDDVAQYVLHGIEPAKTPSGLLVKDKQRDAKTPGEWIYPELCAFLTGELSTSYDRKVVLGEMRKRLGLTERYDEELFLKNLDSDNKMANSDDLFLKARLTEYKTVMSRPTKNLSAETMAAAQTMLYKAVRQVMARSEYASFAEGWNIVLDFINENYTQLFTETLAYRGWNALQMNSKTRSLFENLFTLLIATRSVRERKEIIAIYNLDNILRYLTSEKERQNIVTFYAS